MSREPTLAWRKASAVWRGLSARFLPRAFSTKTSPFLIWFAARSRLSPLPSRRVIYLMCPQGMLMLPRLSLPFLLDVLRETFSFGATAKGNDDGAFDFD